MRPLSISHSGTPRQSCGITSLAITMLVTLMPLSAIAAEPGERYALLVGVGEYSGGRFVALPGAGNDVTELADVLMKQGYRPANLIVMTNGDKKPDRHPTAENIRQQLGLLLGHRQVGDSILVALAGHGLQPPGKPWCYCPADADLNNEKTLISIEDLYKELDGCQAGLKLLLVDACRNDPLSAASRDATDKARLPPSFKLPQLPDPPGGIAAFFSCSAGQVAMERKDNGKSHGVFFKAVIDALDGKAVDDRGQITVEDLAKYVKRDVEEYVRSEYSARQWPEVVKAEPLGEIFRDFQT